MSAIFPRSSAAALGALVLCGCSFVIEPDKNQCSAQSDCMDRFGEDTKLLCIEHVCAEPTCDNDDQCAGFGAGYEGTVCEDHACVPPPLTDDGGQIKEPLDPAWACLDEAPQTQSMPGPFRVKLHVQHMVNQMPMKGVTARLCRKIDLTCASPNSTQMSDDAGDIILSVDANFTGYVSLTRVDLMPTSYFFFPSVQQDVELQPVQLAPTVVAGGLAAAVGSQSPDRGLVLLAAYNCMGTSSAGIILSSKDADDPTTAFYSAGGLPSKTATETEMSGFGGFINAKPGPFVIAGMRASDQRELGEVSILVKAGELTITRFFPSLRP